VIGRAPLGKRLWAAISLVALFLLQVFVSGVTTALWVVRPGKRPPAGLLRIRYSALDETGAAIYGCMLTLTPGSTVIDIDTERQELLLHLLDASHPERTAARARGALEAHLQQLFPERRGA
jgi:multicomponent K+:H+ antiporter subunit E/multicomponent Na+:H+ antiporter subunit E